MGFNPSYSFTEYQIESAFMVYLAKNAELTRSVFLAGLHRNYDTRIRSFALGENRKGQSQHTESIFYRVLPYAKLRKIIDIGCDNFHNINH